MSEEETIELPLSEFIYIIDIVEKSRAFLDNISWQETANEHKMIIYSKTPGGPKVHRDRLRCGLERLEDFFEEKGF
jgi:hypothetical protein